MERISTNYENLSEKFIQYPPDYNKQYCSIYLARLREMHPFLVERIKQKWGDEYPICELHKLSERSYDKCIVIGTLFKDQKLKPSILKQLAESNQLTPQPILTQFTDDTDLLYIEDELQRYQVLGVLKENFVVTGITCALFGSDDGQGKFLATDYVFPGYRPQIERPVFKTDIYILFLSGLNFVEHQNFMPHLEMLTYAINGVLNMNFAAKITRIIIAGNAIKINTKKPPSRISLTSRIGESSESIEAVKVFDAYLADLCKYIEVDIMPGEHDPSNHILPQKKMHFCMFPKSIEFKSCNLVSNPYFFSLDGVKILGHSGQPVLDILKYSNIDDPIEVMENCLKWNHLAPTAPDTLGCYPYYDKDPFVLDDCPHVLFAGNQSKFDSKLTEGDEGQKVLLLSLPQFSQTFEAVSLNLRTLECNSIVFDTK